jgi:hypothetical protein
MPVGVSHYFALRTPHLQVSLGSVESVAKCSLTRAP